MEQPGEDWTVSLQQQVSDDADIERYTRCELKNLPIYKHNGGTYTCWEPNEGQEIILSQHTKHTLLHTDILSRAQ